ncbi:hypothetical protein EVAR_35408_1 [Eumeta japonica]|uniref:Uncharacterized protein n=1 Tax=Eumeta variegata TaxID=151549 RepID=A0A4C1XAU2_EUMVA|nr:hypothetical protein EVAR_35408_1 [Eumeta japonica]
MQSVRCIQCPCLRRRVALESEGGFVSRVIVPDLYTSCTTDNCWGYIVLNYRNRAAALLSNNRRVSFGVSERNWTDTQWPVARKGRLADKYAAIPAALMLDVIKRCSSTLEGVV